MLTGADQGVGDLEGVDHAVAGVADVEGGARQARLGRHDVGVGGFADVCADRREEQQVDVGRMQAGCVKHTCGGAGGEVRGQVAGVGDGAFVQTEGAPHEAFGQLE